MTALQDHVDDYARKHGPCCAGCDWWRYYNSAVGECIRSAPVAGHERTAMLGIDGASLVAGAGHVMTPRDHVCGEYRDTSLATP